MDPIRIEFTKASSFQWSKGFHFSPKVNEPDEAPMTKFGNLAWSATQLISETSPVTPNFFLHFWHKVPTI